MRKHEDGRQMAQNARFLALYVCSQICGNRVVAETEGFEPSVGLPPRFLSRELVSATHPRLRDVRMLCVACKPRAITRGSGPGK